MQSSSEPASFMIYDRRISIHRRYVVRQIFEVLRIENVYEMGAFALDLTVFFLKLTVR